MYLKRKAMPRTWPIPRKGSTYVVKASEKTIPLIIVLRDILGLVKTKKEARNLMIASEVIVDTKPRKEINYAVSLFSVMSLPKIKKFYRIELNKDKLAVNEIKEDESNFKICKIIGKKTLKGGLQQINLVDGRNILSKEKLNVNDSVLISLKDNKIVKSLPTEKGASVIIVGGKNMGSTGKITEVDKKISVKSKDKILNILPKNIYVVEK
jgi:small subunit ribosomal protein S4e